MSAAAATKSATEGSDTSEKKTAQDRQLVEMVMRHQDDHLRRILDDPKRAEILEFEISKAIGNVRKWFPQ